MDHADPIAQQLACAADQFLVARPLPDDPAGRSVIAGYHWFNDWGRDTMISLPGLALATGRTGEAATILRTFARYLQDGLLPNNFPDSAGVIPGYNTVDATLWYVLAIRAYTEATGDDTLVADLLPTLGQIVEHHLHGTRYGIGVDPADGLLRAGEPGVQLTWMDAKVGDWVVTPRIGKPVEINALWYNVLMTLSGFLAATGDEQSAARYAGLAATTRDSFRARFRRPDCAHLADVVDGQDGDDWSLRPNQVFAFSLPHPLLEGDEALAVLATVGRELLTSFGLRSLATGEPGYRGTYGGDQLQRDGAYHQGPVWSWLLGPFAEATYRLTGDRDAACALLRPIGDHLRDAGLGSVSEIFEGDPPHVPKGCIAQAWGVAEVLRVWRLLDAAPAAG
jgi:4-alpha-glucanotransferase